MSLSMMLVTGAGIIVAWLAGSCARLMYRRVKDERDRIQEIHDATNAAGKRLEIVRQEAVKQANQNPIDPKRRDDFEGQP
jgi:hypothetical protein